MATGFAVGVANSILDSLARATTWTAPAAFCLKLHTGDPGSAGTANTAGNTVRQAVTCSAAALGAITNSGAVTWTSVSTSETYSHVSWWSATSAGTFLGSDDLSVPRAVLAGDDFTIAIGDVDLALTPLAA